MKKRQRQVVKAITGAMFFGLFGLMAHAEIILDCTAYAYKWEKSLFGLRQRVSQKYVGVDSNWGKFCKSGKLIFEGSTAVCTRKIKDYLRINPNITVAKVKRFKCPEGAKSPNAPLFTRETKNHDGLRILYVDFLKPKDANKHFKEQNCTYIGPLIAVPAIQTKVNPESWSTAKFPTSYPFINLINPDDYNERTPIPDTDYLYERFVFGDIDENYREKNGGIHKTYIDFGLGEYNRVSWDIDPDTEEKNLDP